MATRSISGWLHIETASPLGAVGALSPRVEINDEAPVPKLPTLQVGDRIERLTHAHRWTGLPLVGVTRTDRGGDLTSLSGAVAVRWTYPRLFMHSDFLLAGHASRNTLRHQESLSFGPWIPLGGQFAVLGLVEAGLVVDGVVRRRRRQARRSPAAVSAAGLVMSRSARTTLCSRNGFVGASTGVWYHRA
ncbi:MAG: hypothetical protein IPQ07_37640 [Myxococcales bacterium]|nr:hypothetical protein [Myxococcales bacterium]